MENNLGLLEEFDVTREIQTPHLLHVNFSPTAKQKVAYLVLSRKPEEVLLINSPGFQIDAVFAGLSEKHIEYIAQKAPSEYKESILAFLDEGDLGAVIEIAKGMDDYLGEKVVQNQNRVQNVIQYIKDNQMAFEF